MRLNASELPSATFHPSWHRIKPTSNQNVLSFFADASRTLSRATYLIKQRTVDLEETLLHTQTSTHSKPAHTLSSSSPLFSSVAHARNFKHTTSRTHARTHASSFSPQLAPRHQRNKTSRRQCPSPWKSPPSKPTTASVPATRTPCSCST